MYRHLSIDIVKEKPNDGKPAAAAAASPTSTCEASVESSLARFFEPEMREIKCEKCHDGTHAEQTLHILSRYVARNNSLGTHPRVRLSAYSAHFTFACDSADPKFCSCT